MEIEQALREAMDWLSLNGVEGVGLGEADGEPCIVILVSSPARTPPGIPWRFHGFKVEIRTAGKFRAG